MTNLKEHFIFQGLPWRFFKKLVFTQIFLAFVIIISTASIARYHLKTYMTHQATEQLSENLELIRQGLYTQHVSPLNWCQSLPRKLKSRFTLVNHEGIVLCDNYANVLEMENHLNRPEISKAFKSGEGSSIRHSDTLGTDLIYGAILLEDKTKDPLKSLIIRQAIPLTRLQMALDDMDNTFFIFIFPLLIIASLVSLWGSLKLSNPVSSILKKVDHMKKITHGEDSDFLLAAGDEWEEIESTLDKAQDNLSRYINDLYLEHVKMSAVLDGISDSILAINSKDNILFANTHFKKNFLTKEIKKKDISRFKLWEVTRDLDIQNMFKSVIESGEQFRDLKIELPIKRGKRNHFFNITINPLRDSKGSLFGAVGIFHDVTEQRLAEQMREDFVANVSHEVRTPLTAIKGYIQIIKNTPNEKIDLVRPLMDKIELGSDRLTNIFTDLLNLSVIESQNKIVKETVSPEDITSNVLLNIKQGHITKDLAVKTEYKIDKIWANPALLEQVLNNLIENAYKYTPDKGQISIQWYKSNDGKMDIFKIEDSGLGIPKESQNRIFERFYRVDPSRSREMGGTGLGLAIVKHIIQKHNGLLSVFSEGEGKGTTFTVELPSHYS